MKYLIDTDILVDLFHNQAYAQLLIPGLIGKGSAYISVLTITELCAGFTREQTEFYLPKLYSLATAIEVDRNIAEIAGEYRFTYHKPIADMLIAATAVSNKCQLITRNKKDFPMPEIKLYPIED